jgi:hypothetical protein
MHGGNRQAEYKGKILTQVTKGGGQQETRLRRNHSEPRIGRLESGLRTRVKVKRQAWLIHLYPISARRS